MSESINSLKVAGKPKWVKTKRAGGSTVTSFSLNHTDKKGNMHYFNVDMWNLEEEQVEFLRNTENTILVFGTLKYNEYTNKDGVKMRNNSILAFKFEKNANNYTPYNPKNIEQEPTERVQSIDSSSDPFDEEDPFA